MTFHPHIHKDDNKLRYTYVTNNSDEQIQTKYKNIHNVLNAFVFSSTAGSRDMSCES